MVERSGCAEELLAPAAQLGKFLFCCLARWGVASVGRFYARDRCLEWACVPLPLSGWGALRSGPVPRMGVSPQAGHLRAEGGARESGTLPFGTGLLGPEEGVRQGEGEHQDDPKGHVRAFQSVPTVSNHDSNARHVPSQARRRWAAPFETTLAPAQLESSALLWRRAPLSSKDSRQGSSPLRAPRRSARKLVAAWRARRAVGKPLPPGSTLARGAWSRAGCLLKGEPLEFGQGRPAARGARTVGSAFLPGGAVKRRVAARPRLVA